MWRKLIATFFTDSKDFARCSRSSTAIINYINSSCQILLPTSNKIRCYFPLPSWQRQRLPLLLSPGFVQRMICGVTIVSHARLHAEQTRTPLLRHTSTQPSDTICRFLGPRLSFVDGVSTSQLQSSGIHFRHTSTQPPSTVDSSAMD